MIVSPVPCMLAWTGIARHLVAEHGVLVFSGTRTSKIQQQLWGYLLEIFDLRRHKMVSLLPPRIGSGKNVDKCKSYLQKPALPLGRRPRYGLFDEDVHVLGHSVVGIFRDARAVLLKELV